MRTRRAPIDKLALRQVGKEDHGRAPDASPARSSKGGPAAAPAEDLTHLRLA